MDEYDNSDGSLTDVGMSFISTIPLKLGVFSFVSLLILLSTQFLTVLQRINPAFVKGECTTGRGTIFLCFIAALLIMILSFLIDYHIL